MLKMNVAIPDTNRGRPEGGKYRSILKEFWESSAQTAEIMDVTSTKAAELYYQGCRQVVKRMDLPVKVIRRNNRIYLSK